MSRKLSREKAMELIFSTMLTKESHEEAIETVSYTHLTLPTNREV